MPRLRHVETGVVVNVDDDTAASLDAEWAPVKEATSPKPAPKRRAPAKK